MHFGLTQRELLQFTQSEKPDITKRGGIDRILNILTDNYEKNEQQRLLILGDTERKRIQKIQTQNGLNPPIRKHLKPQKPRQGKKQTIQENEKSNKWHETLKPGYLPPPGIDHYHTKIVSFKQNELDKSKTVTKSKQESVAHQLEPDTDRPVNPDACLHLPLGMIRDPTPRTRKLLETQQNEPLYELSNQIVHLTKTDNARK